MSLIILIVFLIIPFVHFARSDVGEYTVASTELLNFYSMTTAEINTFLTYIDNQNITMFICRLNAMTEWSSGTSPGIAKTKTIVTAANALGIDVSVDLHTWYTTWDNYFRQTATNREANRADYIDYVENVLGAFSDSNVKAFMVLNEPQARTAVSGENQFIRNILLAAHNATDKPISVRFMGGYSTTTGHYSSSLIDSKSDFYCRNTYWDARNPGTTVYGCSESSLLTANTAAHTAGKEFWITEFGKPYSDQENQRSYVEAFVNWAREKSIDDIFCWASQPDSSGEAYNIWNGYTPRPAFYELTNPEAEEPPVGGYVNLVLNDPNNLENLSALNVFFNYTATAYGCTFKNSSVYANVSGTWQLVAWNTTAIINATMHTINYTFASEGVYIWNVRVFNDTEIATWGSANRTVIIESTPPTDNPPYYGNYSVSTYVYNQTAYFLCQWYDDITLNYGFLSHNKSGYWTNQTALPMFQPYQMFSDTLFLSVPSGTVVGYKFYANDSANQWNSTAILNFTILAEAPEPTDGDIELYVETGGSIGFQHDLDKNQSMVLNVSSGLLHGKNVILTLGSDSGTLTFNNTISTNIFVKGYGDHFLFTCSGSYGTGLGNDTWLLLLPNNQMITLTWTWGIESILDIYTSIGIGMGGLGLMVFGPSWVAWHIKEKGFDDVTMKRVFYLMVLFFVGLGMFMMWAMG